MATSGRKYHGQAQATKCYIGAKSIDVQLSLSQAAKLAENLKKAVEFGNAVVDVGVYATDNGPMSSAEKARITVTSRS